jgi:AsmA protein
MKRRSIVLLSLGAAVVALAAAPFLIPLNAFKAPLESAASAATGRAVRLAGPMHLTLFPQLGLSLSDISIANAQGAREPQMVSVDDVVVGARLMPLLSGRLEVTEVVLRKPVIHLEIAKDGGANWQFGKAPENAAPAASGGNAAGALGVENLRIEDGEIAYYDARSDKNEALTNVSLAMKAAGTGAVRPLSIDGTLTYHGEALKIAIKLNDAGAVMKGQATDANLSLTSNVLNAQFAGRIASGSDFSGTLKLGARSLRRLATWAGAPMPDGNGFGLIALETDLSAKDGVYSLSKANIGFDSMKLNGSLSFDTNPDVLAIRGGLSIDHLDVRPYLAQGASESTVKAAKEATPDAPLALGGLKAINADLRLTVGPLSVPDFKLEHAVIAIALRNGVLNTDLMSFSAYGGTGKGSLTVDASGDTPSFKSALDMRNIKIQPFLVELMNVKQISSTGAVRFDVASRGATQAAIVRNLNGKGDIQFADGTITGVDLGAVARVMQSVLTAQVLTGAVGDNAKTEFGQLGGTFTIQNGVLHTRDIRLTNPTVEMTGTGDVDFNTQQLEFHLEPRAKKGIPGLQLVDIGVPFYVKGPWTKPSFGPDARNLAKGIVNKLGDDAQLPADLLKNPGQTLKSLFGGSR